MSKPDPIFKWGLLLLVPVTVAAVLLAVWTYRGPIRGSFERAGEEMSVVAAVPEFELTDQDGNVFHASQLAGDVWIADFIFTRCAGPCPRMSLGMRQLQGVLEKNEGVRLVSFTVDPDYDTPEVLKEYAKGYGADEERWTFLTGDGSVIRKLAREGFYLGSPELTDDQGRVVHSIYFALVDQKGQIRGYYNGLEEEERSRLARDVRRLLDQG